MAQPIAVTLHERERALDQDVIRRRRTKRPWRVGLMQARLGEMATHVSALANGILPLFHVPPSA